MNRAYTDRPRPPAARLAWDYFAKTYGKPPIEMFFSPKADFYDCRSAGWTAYYGESSAYTTYGVKGVSVFHVAAPETIRYVMTKAPDGS